MFEYDVTYNGTLKMSVEAPSIKGAKRWLRNNFYVQSIEKVKRKKPKKIIRQSSC